MIGNYLMNIFPILEEKKCLIKIAYKKDEEIFNAILLGKQCPISTCCKLPQIVSISGSTGTLKINCMEVLCQFNPLL